MLYQGNEEHFFATMEDAVEYAWSSEGAQEPHRFLSVGGRARYRCAHDDCGRRRYVSKVGTKFRVLEKNIDGTAGHSHDEIAVGRKRWTRKEEEALESLSTAAGGPAMMASTLKKEGFTQGQYRNFAYNRNSRFSRLEDLGPWLQQLTDADAETQKAEKLSVFAYDEIGEGLSAQYAVMLSDVYSSCTKTSQPTRLCTWMPTAIIWKHTRLVTHCGEMRGTPTIPLHGLCFQRERVPQVCLGSSTPCGRRGNLPCAKLH